MEMGEKFSARESFENTLQASGEVKEYLIDS